MLKWTRRMLRLCIAFLILTAISLLPGGMTAAPPPEDVSSLQVHGQGQGERDDVTDTAMLSHELEQWENAAPASLFEDVPGPGAFLGTLLRSFSTASTESDARIKRLVNGIPHVFADLNKVLVAL